MKNNLTRVMTSVLVAFGCWLIPNSISASILIDDLYYDLDINANTAEVSSCNIDYTGDLVIPSIVTYEGVDYVVSSIGNFAFCECSNLHSVVIPNSVLSIGDDAFSFCYNLLSVEIPNGVNSIGNFAFWNCWGLDSIEIPESVSYLGEGTFVDCGLNSIKVNSNNTIYDSRENCNAIIETSTNALVVGCANTEIPNSVITILNHAFEGNTCLVSLTIPNSVTEIGIDAFRDCYNLESIEIPSSVTEIGMGAFTGCTYLSSIEVDPNNEKYDSRENCNAIIATSNNMLLFGCSSSTIPDGVTSIADYAFANCYGLTSIVIPSTVKTIFGNVFEKCTGLTSVEISNGVEMILGNCFLGCSSLTSINIPESVTLIGPECFKGCTGLTSIKIDQNNTVYDSRDNSNAIIETSTNTLLWGCANTVIPNGVTKIGENAFRGISDLTSIVIPGSVTEIEDYAFGDCSGLSSVTVESGTPATIDYRTFFNVDKTTCILYVPNGSKSIYESADYWNEFENIIEIDTDISTLDNVIYVEETEGRIGGTKDISIKLKNSYAVRGFQFTLEVPEGVTINSWALSEDRLPEGATTGDKVSSYSIDGNKISVACALNYGSSTFTENDGEIATVNVSFGEEMAEGSYPLYLTSCDVTTARGSDEDLSEVKSTLVLEMYELGDANGDGKVRIGDATTILNYIVGTETDGFNAKAADANGDGKIRIGDVTVVLNIIVEQ